ncbi:MAG TPA: tetratricopeptide repeat protein [candidate division WOR-3 bacterium]|uniref:Tetratricopeptide repeat protein n=1 Tax=candidate division WOR-3 bacterium TaxID=2052148 RepID=A0A9C9EP99_UNCW3|nr:tetratricopeptide repeat protein [candidate division WOR-3 bacterium]
MKKLILLGFIVLFIGCPSPSLNTARIEYFNRQDFQRAKAVCLEGIKNDPSNFELFAILGGSEIALGNWQPASDALIKAFEIDSLKMSTWLAKQPNSEQYYYQPFYYAARDLFTKGKYEDALKDLKYAEKINPSDARTYTLRGAIYHQTGEIDKAKEQYTKALKVDPDNPDVHFLIGKSLFESKKYDSSMVYFEEAIKNYITTNELNKKVLFSNLPSPDKELEHEILRLWRDKKNNRKKLDEIVKVKLGHDGGLGAVERALEKFYKSNDGLARSYYLLGMAYYNLRDDSTALKNILTSLTFVPDDLDALFYAGELFLRAKKYQEAIKKFETITKLKEDDIYAWFYLAVCYTQLKKYKKAIDLYEGKVLVLSPKNIEAMTNLAYCYREIGNNKKALEYLTKADKLQKEQQ